MSTPNQTSQWLGAVDPSRREAFERAINVAGAGTVLMQTYINRVVQQIHLRELGASAVLPRKPGQGDAAYVNRRAPGATGGAWVNDTDSVSEETGTYTRISRPYKTLATRGKVTRFMQAIGRSYGDLLAGEVAGKTGDFSDKFEKTCIQGNIAVEPKEFDGLITLIQATSSQIVLQTTAVAGDALTLEKLDETIDKVKGASARADLVILASFKGRRLLNAALQAQQQFNDMVDIAAGFRVRTYDGIPIVTSTHVPDVATFNGTKITAFTGSTTTCLIVVNTRYYWLEELTPMTVMPLSKRDSQFDDFDIFWDGSLADGNNLGAAILVGIDAA
jgi:hypothetical protein